MKKLSLSILTVLCAVCFMFGMGLMSTINSASADVAGGAPVLSETKVMRSNDNDKMLLATAIKNYADVYEVGYEFVGEVETTIAEKQRFYTSITTGSNEWTAESIFGGDFADAGLIVWEIAFEIGDSYEFKPYAIYGDRNEQGQLLASGYKVTPEESTVKQFFSVEFATYASQVVSSKIYQSGAEIVVPKEYTIGNDKFEITSHEMPANSVATSNVTYMVHGEKCAPAGFVQGDFNIYGTYYGGAEKAVTDTYVSLSAYDMHGDKRIIGGEKALYRERGAGTHIGSDGSSLTLYYTPNDIMTKMYLGFYIKSGDSIDMSLRLYSGEMDTVVPVTFVDANGNEVAKADLQTETWYTAIYDLMKATATYGQKYKLTLANSDSTISMKAYLRRPYFELDSDVSVDTFNSQIKDNLASTYETIMNRQGETCYVEDGRTIKLTYHNGLLPIYNTTGGAGFFGFTETIWAEYLEYQTSGGKVMKMDFKFIGAGTTVTAYNGQIVNSSSSTIYLSNAAGNNFRQSNNYFKFYNANGDQVLYASLREGVWYTLVIDIDAIKADVGEQRYRDFAGGVKGSSIVIRNSSDPGTYNSIAVGNVTFADK